MLQGNGFPCRVLHLDTPLNISWDYKWVLDTKGFRKFTSHTLSLSALPEDTLQQKWELKQKAETRKQETRPRSLAKEVPSKDNFAAGRVKTRRSGPQEARIQGDSREQWTSWCKTMLVNKIWIITVWQVWCTICKHFKKCCSWKCEVIITFGASDKR